MSTKNLHTGSPKTTTDHDTIKKWVEERGGILVTVKGTGDGKEVGVLRIKFPEQSKEKSKHSLEEILWEDFFKKFDENHLQFLYQEKTRDGQTSRFFKFVKNE